MKITHLTIYRDLPSGIRKQLRFEAAAARALEGVEWTVLACHGGEIKEPFERKIPWLLRFSVLRYLYGWLVAMRLSRSSTIVLLRHMPFDPFAPFFAWLVPNRVSIHHSKEIEELPLIRPGLIGRLAAFMERLSGRVVVRCGLGVLGVTDEIARYECETRGVEKPHARYTNGVDLGLVAPLDDNRDAQALDIVFMSDRFSLWHGLDRLIGAVGSAAELPAELTIHLIGNLPENLREQIEKLPPEKAIFEIHGFLRQDEYRRVLDRSDVGLGSLALDRQNMTQGATLKVREMLAMGLPVWANHADTALPDDFGFYRFKKMIDLLDIAEFARQMKKVDRNDVREASRQYVSKLAEMRQVLPWLAGIVGQSDEGKTT